MVLQVWLTAGLILWWRHGWLDLGLSEERESLPFIR